MENVFHKILFFCTIAVMIIFLTQTVTGVVKLEPLHGATVEAEQPKLTFESYVDGSFQDSLEQYLRAHFGFREILVRSYNQYLWNCFHEPNNATIMRGKGNWLFEEVYVRDFYESLMYDYTDNVDEMKKTFETEVLRFWKVQELLKEYNIHIFLVIPPCKSMIYPEYLPKNRTYFRPEGLHAYDYYTRRFDELGINYIDFVPVFKRMKNTVNYPLFTETGSHWSNIASVYAFDTIVKYMESLGGDNLFNLDIGERFPGETRSPDNDAEQLLNLIFPIKSPRNVYAEVRVKEDSTTVKPNFLAVGDSYYFNIAGTVPIWEIFQSYPYWFYNSSIYADDEHTSTLEVDIERELMRPDYIMLIYNPVTMYEFSSYFLPRALLHLCFDRAAIDSLALDLVQSITRHNPTLYKKAQMVAKNTNQRLEDVLYGDALYLLRTDPELYINELKGDTLPTLRNKDLDSIRNNRTFAPPRK